jgi:DNA-binding LacI/PurR family transcriptional regulator
MSTETSAAEPKRPATIYDVAKQAGVSHATVTRLIKGFEGIRPATRARVEQAIEELDYRPNLAARSLITGRSFRIGALTHELDQVGPSRIVEGAAAAARRAGYVLEIITLDMTDPEAVRESLAIATEPDLAGLLVLSSTDEMHEIFAEATFRVPTHFATEQEGDIEGPTAPLDHALDQIVDHLAALGHRRFFHIGGASNWTPARNRAVAYTAALQARGLVSRGSVFGDWSSASGYRAAAQVPPDVTAVVAANDQMALGAMLQLRERGIDVPGDVSVTGIDDVPESAYYFPPLTTVRLDFIAQGAEALSRLLSQIDPAHSPAPAPARPKLIIRASTGPATGQP